MLKTSNNQQHQYYQRLRYNANNIGVVVNLQDVIFVPNGFFICGYSVKDVIDTVFIHELLIGFNYQLIDKDDVEKMVYVKLESRILD